ncbi:MAG: magnesium transporter [Spirochaetes bacterium]|nr:magnesium transporter [Spirochaetota bacterium]
MAAVLENIKKYMSKFQDDEFKKMVAGITISELLDLWDDLSEEEELKIFSLLDLEKKVDLITSLPPPKQEALITSLTAENKKILLEEMEPDDITDFIQSVSPEVREYVWNNLSEEAREETKFLLRFDEDDAAGLMTPRYLAIQSNLTVKQALRWVRKNLKEVETIYYLYVLDQMKRLIGIVSLKDLLSAEDEDRINDIMVKKVISVREETDQEEVAKILETYGLLALPVVDRYNRLLGIVTFDDVIDVIRDEQTEDVYKMSAMAGNTERYLDSSVWDLVKKRIPWLTILLLAATLTTNVLAHYKSVIEVAVVLSFFIPIVTGTGGNSGSQSATLMIRGLATDEIHFDDIFKVLLKEILIGVVIGISMGLLTIARSMYLPPNISFHVAAAVGVSMVFVIIFATLIGALFPLIIHKLGLDPTVMAGPLMATIIDVTGLTIYFQTAKLLLGLH